MRDCPTDAALLAVHLGESPAGDARHVAGCASCTRRLALLRADLAEIEAILATTAPPARRRRLRPVALGLAPLAVVAVVALLLLAVRTPTPTSAPAPGNAEVVSFLDDVSAALAPTDPFAGVERDGDPAPSGVELVLDARSTCTLDDPFIGTGCQDGAQLTEEW
jgi:hypothetical protein